MTSSNCLGKKYRADKQGFNLTKRKLICSDKYYFRKFAVSIAALLLNLKTKISHIALLFVLLFSAGIGAKAQQAPIFTNYANSYAYANAGFAGMSEGINVLGLYRMQWAGFVDNDGNEIAPTTFLLSGDMPFRKVEATTDEAVRVFRERGFLDKVKLLETSGQLYSDYYTLGDTVDFYYGPLVPSAGYLKVWGLERYHDGLLLRVPDKRNPLVLAEKVEQPRTFEVFAEKVRWDVIMRLSNAGDVNKAVLNGYASELIQVSEALQEKKIVKIAEEIDARFRRKKHPIRLVLITGPSSSGKSTFCKRLSVQLLACGLRPLSFSTDDYFVNRVDTPKLPNGQYDFDNIETVDYRLLGDHLARLMKGDTVEVPEYNFVTGKREYNGKKLRLSGDSVLIIEGIHALNPLLTKGVDDRLKYKIYISALTSISLDDHNWVPTQDNRLLRRIIRDYNKGAYTARETISQWKSVCEAEDQWIFPFQETADVMFNSALNIEFAVLRTHAEVILASVPKNCPEFGEAHRLLKFLHYFIPISDKEIPPTSIMREFVGGSSFKY